MSTPAMNPMAKLARWAVAAALAPAALLANIPSSAVAATTWQLAAGTQTHTGDVQALAFLPNELWIDQGDSVTWRVSSLEDHTVTVLDSATYQYPAANFNTAPASANPFDYKGPGGSTCLGVTQTGGATVCANSGDLSQGQSYTITFDAPPGDYVFLCLIHRYMSGTVHVQRSGSPYPHNQEFYDDEATHQARELLDHVQRLAREEREATGQNQVSVGGGFTTSNAGGFQSAMIPRFLSRELDVKVGDTVTWTADDPISPHTITFGAQPAGPPKNPVGVTCTGASTPRTCTPGETVTLSAPYPTLYTGPTVSSGDVGAYHPPPPPPALAPPNFGATFIVRSRRLSSRFSCAPRQRCTRPSPLLRRR